ncbi:MAG: glutathione S-transferase family protein [Thermodesulfobacteriota bacterium]
MDRDTFFRFYGSEVSYFTGKVRPALRVKRIPHADIVATPRVYREVIRPRTGLGFIPVVVTPEGDTWQDTSEILDALEARFPEPALYPQKPLQRVVAYLWELYADEFLIAPALHYRWSFPESVTKARADFAATNGDPEMAGKFADRMSSVLPGVGVVPETIPAFEAHVAELLDDLERHLERHPYLLGGKPSLADCALMGPMYAHLYLDAVPGRMLRERALRTCHWIERMNHPDPDDMGDWLAGDAVAETMRPMLARMARDAGPYVLDTVRAFEEWADQHRADGDEPPRGVGFHQTTLRGIGFGRYTSPYTLWMLQRVLDAYRALWPGDRAAVDRALEGTGCAAFLAYAPRHRLEKRGFKLAFARAPRDTRAHG